MEIPPVAFSGLNNTQGHSSVYGLINYISHSQSSGNSLPVNNNISDNAIKAGQNRFSAIHHLKSAQSGIVESLSRDILEAIARNTGPIKTNNLTLNVNINLPVQAVFNSQPSPSLTIDTYDRSANHDSHLDIGIYGRDGLRKWI